MPLAIRTKQQQQKNYYHNCIHDWNENKTQMMMMMMNELTRKSAYILRLLPFVFLLITSNDKQNVLPYVVFLWITHRCDNCIRHKSMATQFFFPESIIVFCLKITHCSRGACTQFRAVECYTTHWVTCYPKKQKKPVFEIIIKKVEWKKRALWAAATAAAARQIQHVLA